MVKVAFEAVQRAFLGLAFGFFAGEVGLGGWVAAVLSGGARSVAGSGALGLGGRTQTGQAAFCSLGREPVDIAGRPCD